MLSAVSGFLISCASPAAGSPGRRSAPSAASAPPRAAPGHVAQQHDAAQRAVRLVLEDVGIGTDPPDMAPPRTTAKSWSQTAAALGDAVCQLDQGTSAEEMPAAADRRTRTPTSRCGSRPY